MPISFLTFSDFKELILLHILIYLGQFLLLSGIILGYFYGKQNLTFQNHECSYALFSGCSEAESPPDTFKDSNCFLDKR